MVNKYINILILTLTLILLNTKLGHAQYNPIPDEVNTSGCPADPTQCAGYKFRADINGKLSGASTSAPTLVPYNFAQLPSEVNGQSYYCNDCTINTTPCTGSGTGAIAQGINGQYVCGSAGTGSLITSGAGDFGVGTSQTGGVLTGTVTNGSHLAARTVPPSAIPMDASLNYGTSNVLGLNVTPEEYGALANSKTYYAGSMISSTSTVTDTTNSPFTSAVCQGGSGCTGTHGNYLICFDQVSSGTITDYNYLYSPVTRHTELCGTITSYNSTSSVGTSFTNASGSTVSNMTYTFAANDTTAVQAAENAVCTAGGGAVWFPALGYGLNSTINKCTTATVNWYGFGSSQKDLFLAEITNASGGTYPSFLTWGTNLQWLTKSMSSSSAGVAFEATGANKTVWWNKDTIANLSLSAGVGTSYDGGGGDGVGIYDWWGLSFVNVTVNGFAQNGYHLGTLGSGGNDYTGDISWTQGDIQENAQGIFFDQSGGGVTQNMTIQSTNVQNNYYNGLLDTASLFSLHVYGASFQRNDEGNSTSYTDVNFSNASCIGCGFDGNYFESDFSNESLLIGFGEAGDREFPNVRNNYFLCLGGHSSQYAIYLGFNSTNNEVGPAEISGNTFQECAAGHNIAAIAVKNITFSQNNTSDVDLYDIYDSTSNGIAFAAKNTGNVVLGTPVTVSSLPGTCVKGDVREVTDAITSSTCIGGGSNAAIAVCSSTNTWTCSAPGTTDPTLSTTNGVTGFNITPEQEGAKGNTIINYAGAMDNNATANLTDTTNSPFNSSMCTGGSGCTGTSAYLVCVAGSSATTVTDKAGTRHVETCGTISSYTSSSMVGLSFQNTSGASISSVQYAFGANDTTAVQAAETAACNAGGGTVWWTHMYGLNASINKCTTATVNDFGFGANMLYNAASSPVFINKLGSGGWWLTKSMSGPGLSFIGTAGNTLQATQDVVSNLVLAAGVGALVTNSGMSGNYDGGSSSSAAIGIEDWNNVTVRNSIMWGWGKSAFYIDVLASSVNDYVAGVVSEGNHIYGNQRGVVIGSSATAGDGGFIQNLHFLDTQVLNNLDDGYVYDFADLYNLTIDGSKTVTQGNDQAQSSSFAEIDIQSTCVGCQISGTYFETDYTNDISILTTNLGSSIQVPRIESNEFFCNNGVGNTITLGSNPNRAGFSVISNNKFSSNCGTPPINNAFVVSLKEDANVCGSNNVSCDMEDRFDSNGNQAFTVNNTGGLILGGVGAHAIYSGFAPGGSVASFELDGGNTYIPLIVDYQTAQSNTNQFIGGFVVANGTASDTEKRGAGVYATSASSQLTHASENLSLWANNAGTFQADAIISSTGGFLLQSGLNATSFTDPGASNFKAAGSIVASTESGTTPVAIASLPACSSTLAGLTASVNNSDAACSFNNAPTHSTCSVGSSCYTCQVQCAESGGSTYAWIAY